MGGAGVEVGAGDFDEVPGRPNGADDPAFVCGHQEQLGVAPQPGANGLRCIGQRVLRGGTGPAIEDVVYIVRAALAEVDVVRHRFTSVRRG